MVGAQKGVGQDKLFSTLREMLNPKHPLYMLADRMPWAEFETSFKGLYSHTGRKAKPVRLMVSLLVLKQMYGLSDERVVAQWDFPCAASDLTHFRDRIGESGVQKILEVSIKFHGPEALEEQVIAGTPSGRHAFRGQKKQRGSGRQNIFDFYISMFVFLKLQEVV